MADERTKPGRWMGEESIIDDPARSAFARLEARSRGLLSYVSDRPWDPMHFVVDAGRLLINHWIGRTIEAFEEDPEFWLHQRLREAEEENAHLRRELMERKEGNA